MSCFQNSQLELLTVVFLCQSPHMVPNFPLTIRQQFFIANFELMEYDKLRKYRKPNRTELSVEMGV